MSAASKAILDEARKSNAASLALKAIIEAERGKIEAAWAKPRSAPIEDEMVTDYGRLKTFRCGAGPWWGFEVTAGQPRGIIRGIGYVSARAAKIHAEKVIGMNDGCTRGHKLGRYKDRRYNPGRCIECTIRVNRQVHARRRQRLGTAP